MSTGEQGTAEAKLLLDANVNILLYFELRNRGYDVEWLTGSKREWLNDQLVEYAVREGRVIVTHDKEFHKALSQELLKRASIIVLDVHPASIGLMKAVIDRFLEEALEKLDKGANIVILSSEGIEVYRESSQ